MRYIRAEDVLPKNLIDEIQRYADGVTLYIPRKAENRRDRGCSTDYRRELAKRNAAIREEKAVGISTGELAEKYHLSEKSIQRILRTK